jgi:hypothetical protein
MVTPLKYGFTKATGITIKTQSSIAPEYIHNLSLIYIKAMGDVQVFISLFINMKTPLCTESLVK